MRLSETFETAMQRYGLIFDLLVSMGGAPAHESMRQDFLYRHARCGEPCEEFRFQGKLGFGGKYWSRTNRVSCYLQDQTPERLELIERLNAELAKLPAL